ncbi:GntR family transcriptional regulator [Hymenobacter defluvii]|uniref:GntR family transcriptional regulator n=1 Tax=Hymenobacter defluvii TaxID=2054411 RepID=A0ABS3TDS6_9BACT|nr:GntR family transcriptional regulator [Hymenobacter defluvii]MBO3271508.1 GntR family transcriptional regulator [Hymenobacter defluvii]
MEFKDNEAIYLQIAGYMSDHILLGKWQADEKIPSVRELAGDLQVNPNTVMRTYDLLQQQEVIYNKRGLGFFVAPEAAQQVKALRKERFLQQELPEFFKTVSLLDISLEEVQERYTRFQQEQTATLPSS